MMDPKVTYAQYRNSTKQSSSQNEHKSPTLSRSKPAPTSTRAPTKRQASTLNLSPPSTPQEAYEIKVIMPPSMPLVQIKKEKELKLGNPSMEWVPTNGTEMGIGTRPFRHSS